MLGVKFPPVVATVKLLGSNNQRPDAPLAALVSILILSPILKLWPEVSILPPSPPFKPPLENKLPETVVNEFGFVTSDQAAIVPPSPSLVAEAFRILPPSIVVLRAWRTVGSEF